MKHFSETQKSTHLIEKLVLIMIEARFSVVIFSLNFLYYLFLLLLHFRLLNFSIHLPCPSSFCTTFPFFILIILYSSCFQQISSHTPETNANPISKSVKQNYRKNRLLRNIISKLLSTGHFLLMLPFAFLNPVIFPSCFPPVVPLFFSLIHDFQEDTLSNCISS